MKTNVLQLIGSFHTGGSERQAVQLARLLRKNDGYRIFLACLDKSGDLIEEVSGFGEIPEFRLTSFYNANFLRQVGLCARFVRNNNIEIVQTHDFYTNVFGMAAARLAGVRARIAAKRETGEMRSGGQKIIEKQAFRFAAAIVANSEAVKNFLIAEGIAAGKIATIYNGLDLERFNPVSSLSREQVLQKLNLSIDKTQKIVTIVANLRHAVKNQEMFLRAAKRVSEKFGEVRFVLAGEGERMNELKRLASELKIGDKTFFINRCDDVPALLRISDVCALSSKSEGFANAILEYMAAARPVAATSVGGAAEAIVEGENGYLIESNDDSKMAEKILYLLENNDKARRMGERGRQIVEQKFSCSAQLEKTLELYQRLLER